MKTKEYELLDGRVIRAKYDRLKMCKISQENLESFVKEFNASYRQAKILEKIKENYALMKLDERKVGRWEKYCKPRDGEQHYICTICNNYVNFGIWGDYYTKNFRYCPHCGAKMEQDKAESEE